jgi:hypothetical protein
MSGPMSERAPDITVEADGHADSTTVLAWQSCYCGQWFQVRVRVSCHGVNLNCSDFGGSSSEVTVSTVLVTEWSP